VTVTDSAGAPAAATSVVCTITLPDGTTVTPAVTNPATGSYQVAYTPATVGFYMVAWAASGANASAYRDNFTVSDGSAFISLADAKRFLDIDHTSDDEELRDFIRVATAAVREVTGVQLEPVAVTELHDVHAGQSSLLLRKPFALSITDVSEFGVALDPSTFRLRAGGEWVDKLSGNSLGVFASGINSVQVEYFAGVTGDKLAISQHVVKQMLLHLWQTQRGSKGSGLPLGDGQWNSGAGYSFPNRVKELLAPLTQDGFA
jgi:hypothetical protein